jgi:hypothetical protein
MKLTLLSIGFVSGTICGVSVALSFGFLSNSASEVWVSTQEVRSNSGIVIPKGTALIVHTHMPEGFTALNLGINVEGEELSSFAKHKEHKPHPRIPYFVINSSKE